MFFGGSYPNAIKGDWFQEEGPIAFNLALVDRYRERYNVPQTTLEDYPVPQASRFVQPINCDVNIAEVVMAFFDWHSSSVNQTIAQLSET